jgi:diacylglycerol kinase
MFHKHTISFQHALDGLRWALKTQPNYRIHLALSVLALLGAWFFGISREEVLTILVLITIGLSIETVNTAIEATNDALDSTIRPDIKLAKDLGAAAMLMFSIGAFVISAMIFIPRIVSFLNIY